MPAYELTVNGRREKVTTEAERPLLDVIREDLGLTGTKYGCGEGQCRACSVLLDGKPVTSCLIPIRAAAGKNVVTIEGLAKDGQLDRVQQAFIDEAAMQCGYCVPGLVVRTVALLKQTPNPDENQIVEALNGSLCRCCGYPNILAGVKRAANGGNRATRA
jgi:aerobic-type carbon monoxide dehydrogenase small subunit (CoxS/CutS family)